MFSDDVSHFIHKHGTGFSGTRHAGSLGQAVSVLNTSSGRRVFLDLFGAPALVGPQLDHWPGKI